MARDEFIEEVYGDQDFQTAEEVAVQVAEAIEYMEWELAAAATDAYDRAAYKGYHTTIDYTGALLDRLAHV